MTNTQEGSQLLKADTLGRVCTPRARREQLLDEFERSGLSGAKFAALAGLKYPTFAAWAQARRRRRGGTGEATVAKDPAASVRWLEAVLDRSAGPAGSEDSALIVHLPGGARLAVAGTQQAAWAAVLLRALAQPPTPC
ncbi:MAG: IS66 family insertion sequence element accessory protein TnpB [Verrucomicrobia bacterium]|nr:IS66 family insertion sequence element accessory protein TnpB [Verrucomicrobiota bacterium]